MGEEEADTHLHTDEERRGEKDTHACMKAQIM